MYMQQEVEKVVEKKVKVDVEEEDEVKEVEEVVKEGETFLKRLRTDNHNFVIIIIIFKFIQS